jgi:hypothetical protein
VHRRRRQRTLTTRTPPRRTRGLHLDTLVIYARQKDWKLDQVTVDIDYGHQATPRTADVAIHITGDLTAEQRAAGIERRCAS